VYAVGGPAAAADTTATALAGADRYATATAVATQFFTAPTTIGVASGVTFADALSGGAYLAHAGGPLVLSDPAVLPASTSTYLTANAATVTTATLFGGTSDRRPALTSSAGRFMSENPSQLAVEETARAQPTPRRSFDLAACAAG
jgi:hypothetical protein